MDESPSPVEVNHAIPYKRRRESEDSQGGGTVSDPGHRTPLRLGRCLRRLVTLVDRVEDLVNEADRRASLDESELENCSEEENWLYDAYKLLLRWQPSLRHVFESEADLSLVSEIQRELNKGGDSARGDDAASLKREVIRWLTLARPTTPEPSLRPTEKDGPDYDWNKEEHRAAIRDYHSDFLVTAYSWPAFLYENLKEGYDENNPVKGFLRNPLLVKAFKHIFMSPTSATKMDCEEMLQTWSKREGHSTRAHVAALLGMRSISPRAIAYIAVQLRFALSNCNTWRLVDGEFNYQDFYHNIVHFFESTVTPERREEVSDLLFWWNRMIFGRTNMSIYRPQDTNKLSVAKLLQQRA